MFAQALARARFALLRYKVVGRRSQKLLPWYTHHQSVECLGRKSGVDIGCKNHEKRYGIGRYDLVVLVRAFVFF